MPTKRPSDRNPLTRTRPEVLASSAILANGVIYGTDVFGANIVRAPSPGSASAPSPNRSATRHHITDHRFLRIGAWGLIAA